LPSRSDYTSHLPGGALFPSFIASRHGRGPDCRRSDWLGAGAGRASGGAAKGGQLGGA